MYYCISNNIAIFSHIILSKENTNIQMRKLLYIIVLFGTLTFTGCNLPKMIKMADQQQLTVNPNPLEVHADTVSFEISANLPVKMLKKGLVYTINTFYKYGDQEMAIGSIEFDGDQYPSADTQAPRVSETFSFPYDPALIRGDVEVQGVARDKKNGKTKATPQRLQIAKGIITTSKLAQKSYYAAYAGHGYNNQEELSPTNIDFFFDQGKSVLKRSERRSERGKYFEAFIADKNVTRTVTITGTHSPEGTETINSGLSQDRASVIEGFYQTNMKKYDYKGMADSIKFILKPVIEDWNGFKTALSNYDGISTTDKSEYTSIVNGPGNFEEKEKLLQKLPAYDKVFDDIYPPLRSAKTNILTVKDKKTDAQIAVLSKQISGEEVSADTLSSEELMYAATLTPSLTEKEAIYKAATKKDDSWSAHNNLGAVYIEMAMQNPDDMNRYADMAATQCDISNNKKENAQAYINLGSAHLMQGNVYAAADALRKASSLSPSGDDSRGANGVLGAIEIMIADYSRAVSSLSNSSDSPVNDFNRGLAQLLNKDFQNALTSFQEAAQGDSDMALADYGAAIANARLGQQDAAITSITSAVQKDPSLKQKALSDLEFDGISGQQAFRDAMN